MRNADRSASAMDAGRKEWIRNMIIGIVAVLLIAAIVTLLVSRGNNGPSYTDVNKSSGQTAETNSGDDIENSSPEGEKIDVDNLPKVPVEPAP